jgi:serine/threonine protein kinase/WD40 repeat protein
MKVLMNFSRLPRPTACPDATIWRALLDGDVSDAEEAQLGEHLTNCEACRERLESSCAEGAQYLQWRRRSHPGRSGREEALVRLMDSLRRHSTNASEPVVPPERDTVRLDFLEPPVEPGELGRLGHYAIKSVVGQGGMGIVLKAIDLALQRVVAIKVLAPHLASHATARQRFVREARAAASIRNEHVIDIHAVEEADGLPYIVMEFIHGVSVQDKLDRAGPLELQQVLRIGVQVARGLEAAHAQGLVHRDTKPANILLENGVERVKITDFGLARAVDDASLTQSGMVTGTPLFMSPEQARGEALDARSDLFSLGSVLYTLCLGRPPFRAADSLAVLKRITDESPRRLRDADPSLPDWLAEIIERLMAKDPAARIQTAAQLADLLGQHLAHLQQPTKIAAPPRLPPAPARPALAAPVAPWRFWHWSAGCLAALALAGYWFGPGIYRVATNQGELVIETDDPDVEVTVRKEGEPVTILDRKSGRKVTLQAGKYQLELGEGAAGLTLSTNHFTLERGGKEIVRVRLGPPVITEVRRFEGHEDCVWSAAFCLGGRAVLSGGGGYLKDGQWQAGSDYAIRLWDMETGKVLRRFDGPHTTHAIAVSPDGRRALSSHARFDGGPELANYPILLWDLDTGKELRRLEDHTARCAALVYLPDGSHALSAGSDAGDGSCAIRLWDLETGKVLRRLEGHANEIKTLALSSDGRLLLSGCADGTDRLWDLATGKEIRRLNVPAEGAGRIALSPDGRLALSAGPSATIHLCDLATGKRIRTFRGHHGAWLDGVAFSPDGRRALSAGGGGDDHSVRLWDVQTGTELCRFEGHDAPAIVTNRSFSADGRHALSFGWDRTVRLLKLPPPDPGAADKKK